MFLNRFTFSSINVHCFLLPVHYLKYFSTCVVYIHGKLCKITIFLIYRSLDGDKELKKDFFQNTQEQARLMMLKAFLLSYMDS